MKKQNNKKYAYLHTIDGEPASFNGEQIVTSHRAIPIVKTLKLIHKHQLLSYRFRASHNYGTVDMKYDYVRLWVNPKN